MSNFLKLVDVIMSKYGYVCGLRRKAHFRRQKLSKNRRTVSTKMSSQKLGNLQFDRVMQKQLKQLA